jgi:tetratricopeptide (TPR) repeat protein
LAIFSWGKGGKGGAGAGSGGGAGGAPAPGGADTGWTPDPNKARVWFNHARTAFETQNFEYALTCFASGLRLDPSPMPVHEDMFSAALRYIQTGGKPASGKEVRQIEGDKPREVEKFAAAEFAWMKDLNSLSTAIKLLEAAVQANQTAFGKWFSPKLMNMLRLQKKPSKSSYIQAMELFQKLGEWDAAFACGQAAVNLDPTDSKLSDELRQLIAQRAIAHGGYETVQNQEGGFRQFVKDADRQKELEEQDSISGTAGAESRNVERARLEYEANPTQPDVINKYAQLLRRLGTPETEEKALQIYELGYEATKEYRFRMEAGELRINQMRRRVRAADDAAAAAPTDAGKAAEAKRLRAELLAMESQEYRDRADHYPTDRRIKFDLGRVEFELGRYEEAMEAFQKCKDEPRLRVAAGHLLGRCFAAEGWHQEALGEYREALAVIDATERDRELDIRYDMMLSLIALARAEKSLALAKEALDICSQIARKNISFRDIRARRKELDALIKDLGGAAT